MTDLNDVASDLSTFLSVVKAPPRTPAPQFTPAEEAVTLPPVVDPTARHRQLVRAVFDYVTSRLTESDGARTIGESYMLAVAALAKDTGTPLEDLNNAAILFLEDIVEVAREGL